MAYDYATYLFVTILIALLLFIIWVLLDYFKFKRLNKFIEHIDSILS